MACVVFGHAFLSGWSCGYEGARQGGEASSGVRVQGAGRFSSPLLLIGGLTRQVNLEYATLEGAECSFANLTDAKMMRVKAAKVWSVVRAAARLVCFLALPLPYLRHERVALCLLFLCSVARLRVTASLFSCVCALPSVCGPRDDAPTRGCGSLALRLASLIQE